MPHLKMFSVSFMSVAGQLQISEGIRIRGFRCSRIALSRLAFCASCLAKRLQKIVKDWLQRLSPFGLPMGHVSKRKPPGAPSDPKFRRQFAT